jgi:hypothetical protein
MTASDNDPIEYVGNSKERAEPLAVKAAVAPPVAPAPIAPAPRVAKISKPIAEPPVEIACEPFDQLGNIVAPPVEVVASLSAEKRSLLMAMLKANLEAKDAETFVATTQRNLHAAVSDARIKRAEFEKLKPRTTHAEELRRVIAARGGKPLPVPPVNPKAEAAAIVADEADELITTLQCQLPSDQSKLAEKRNALSKAILAWQGLLPQRQVWELVKERAAAEQARRLDRIARGLPRDDAADEPVYKEAIDQIYAPHRGSIDVNWRRPPGSLLGGPAPKVASER